uniref:Uncharacterized protein n=1 Tax=Avena sativa TaxID=4498 RepID=A0ACD5YAU9_AVESA
MASLMLASADLLLSPRVPQATPHQPSAKLVQLVQQPSEKPALRIKVLFSLYNLRPSPYGKAFVYRKALEVAAAGKAADCVIPSFKNIDTFVADWGIGKLGQRELFLAVSRILKDQKGMSKEYFNFLNKYLAAFDGSGDDVDVIGEAKEEAAAAIIEFVKSSDLYQRKMKYQPVYELLKIFLTKRLDSYLEFQSANSTLLQGYGMFY